MGVVLAAPALPAPTSSAILPAALALAERVEAAALKAQLGREICGGFVRRGEFAEAYKLAVTLPAFEHAAALIALAEKLPADQRDEAEKLLLDAQTERTLTADWHKSRVSRLLAAAHAKLGHFETAVEMARDVPDTEDRIHLGWIKEFPVFGTVNISSDGPDST
jgi:hypothetical protein